MTLELNAKQLARSCAEERNDRAAAIWLRAIASQHGHLTAATRRAMIDCADRIDELSGLRYRMRLVIANLKRLPNSWTGDGEPSQLNGRLWVRVARLLNFGSSQAIRLCNQFGENPDWKSVGNESLGQLDNMREGLPIGSLRVARAKGF